MPQSDGEPGGRVALVPVPSCGVHSSVSAQAELPTPLFSDKGNDREPPPKFCTDGCVGERV